jgi:hypothetical protein
MGEIPKYVSAEKYSELSGIGVEEVKRLCRIGEIEHFRTEKGYYKIAVRQDCVKKELYDKVVEENAKLKGIIQSINLATNI